jgi:hypothetical protein
MVKKCLNLLLAVGLVRSVSISKKKELIEINDNYLAYVGDLADHKDQSESELKPQGFDKNSPGSSFDV